MTPEQFLGLHPLLKGLESAERTRLVRRSAIKTFPARSTVFFREDEADGVYGILSGSVVVTVDSPGGGDLILQLLSEGQLFGELAVVDGRGRTASVITRTPCTFLFIPRMVFLEVIAAHPDVAASVTLALSDYLRRNTRMVSEAAFLDVTQRLARLLVELGSGSRATAGGGAAIQVSQYELAGMLGVSREIVNRHLTSLRRSGLVETSQGRIRLLDRRALEVLARETQH